MGGHTVEVASFLVPEPGETYSAAPSLMVPGRWSLETGTLRVEAQADPPRIRIYRTSDAGEDPVCELREPTPEAASIFIDRGFALYGVGGNNALKLRTTHDIDLLTDIDLDRRDKVYRIHHRETGQGVNHMPWVLSAQGFGLFLDSSFPMTLDLRDGFGVEGQNIRTYYFINGPTPAAAVSRFVKLTGLPPMHPAWALGYEQSSRTWMNPGELDFVTTYFREKRIPCDGFVLLSTYGGDGGVGRSARGFHAGYPDLYQGWNPYGSYTGYNPKLLPGGAEDIRRLRERGFHPIVHGYWASDYSDPEACESVWQEHKYLYEDGWEGWWLDGTEYVNVVPRGGTTRRYLPDYLPQDMSKFESKEFLDEYDNVWALLRAKTFYEKQRRDFPDRRVYILNRTAFPGMQRYAAGCNQGDFWSSWEMMQTQTVWLLNMQMSGIFFPESDIGGFFPTEHLTDELFIRWAFMGVFGAAHEVARSELADPPPVGVRAGERGAIHPPHTPALVHAPLQLHAAEPRQPDRDPHDARHGDGVPGGHGGQEALGPVHVGAGHPGGPGVPEGSPGAERLSAGEQVAPLLDAAAFRWPQQGHGGCSPGTRPLVRPGRHGAADAGALGHGPVGVGRSPRPAGDAGRGAGLFYHVRR